ncbi:MAG: hypothetical protein JSW46_14775 [Gemmatimonadota bacterium]|nr:MAG: hypothetical protein JSW46_14775 [Gemmatimonadota bacterium]
MRFALFVLAMFAIPAGAQLSCSEPLQAPEDDVEILTQAVEAVLSQILPEGTFAIQPRFFGEEAGIQPEQVLVDVASRVGVTEFVNYNEAVTCPGLPNTCRLAIRGSAVVAVERPVVEDGTARVVIHMTYRSNSQRQPVTGYSVEVSLLRQNEGWTVTDIKGIRIT